jgi:hypothetical protein
MNISRMSSVLDDICVNKHKTTYKILEEKNSKLGQFLVVSKYTATLLLYYESLM